jgi:hypothetical protein
MSIARTFSSPCSSRRGLALVMTICVGFFDLKHEAGAPLKVKKGGRPILRRWSEMEGRRRKAQSGRQRPKSDQAACGALNF